MSCVYLRKRDGKSDLCNLHDTKARCKKCEDTLTLDDPDLSSKFKDPLILTDQDRNKITCLRNLLAGRPSFLVCGGPSANQFPLEMLDNRGCWSIAVNNMGGHSRFRPNAFTCSDPPKKFHNGIWLDPGIMKIIPIPKTKRNRGKLREKLPDGSFRDLRDEKGEIVSSCDCPNVWGYGRRSWMALDETFFTDVDAAWGNHNVGVKKTGQPKCVCTMLLAIRILYYLGSRRIFLVGVDFNMDSSRDLLANYAFGEERDDGACRSNNSHYDIVNKQLCEMQEGGIFKRFGLEIFNCFSNSGLRAFPYVPFEDAVGCATMGIPSGPFDLRNWYKP